MDTKTGRKPSGIHWLAPTTVLVSLMLGVLLAVGHHLFYHSLDKTRAHTDGYNFLGTEVSSQEMNTALGTALAFLVQMALVTAISVAYVQLLWRAMLRASRPATLQSLDTLFSGLSSLVSLLKVWTWRRYPLLFAFALVAWLVPIASVITPATLSVTFALVDPPFSSMRHVPNLQWVSLNYVNEIGEIFDIAPVPPPFTYNGPSTEVSGVVRAVSSTNSILPIPFAAPNASWAIDFVGPSLKCMDVSQSARSDIADNVVSAMGPGGPYPTPCIAYGFLAWTKGLPFVKTQNASYEANTATFTDDNGSDAKLYLLASPNMMNWYLGGTTIYVQACLSSPSSVRESIADSTMLECQLLNSTYHADFKYVNGNQTITLSSHPITNNVLTSISEVFLNDWDYTCANGNEVLMDGDSCGFDATVLSTLSYQAIMDAFQQLLSGTIYIDPASGNTVGTSPVRSTALIDTSELQFLNLPYGGPASGPILQDIVETWTDHKGLVNSNSGKQSMPLAQAIEQLFQNITISMMSAPHLKPNLTSQYAPGPVNVTLHKFHNIYTYSSTKLWIAYGTAISFSAMSAVVGLVVLALAGKSYNSDFSSIFRVARRTEMAIRIKDEDADGKSPLPAYLSRMEVRLQVPDKRTSQHPHPVEKKQNDALHTKAALDRRQTR